MALTDLTRISTSGIATGSTIDSPILRKDVSLRGSQVGVTSALFDSSDDALEFNDNVKLKFGNDGDLKIYHDPLNGSYIQDVGYGQLRFLSNDYVFYNAAGNENLVRITENIGVSLYDGANTVRLATNDNGVVVTGILTATSFSGGGGISAGVVTCTGLDLNGNGDVSGNFVIGGDLTVNGTTTTLDTNLTEVDRIEVGANSNTLAGIAVTQSGSADIINLYDGSTKKLVVDDKGNVGIKTLAPAHDLDVYLNGRFNQLGAGGYGALVGPGTNTGGFTYMSSGDMEISCAMTNKDIVFSDAVGGNQRMRLTGDTGRLGIGTNNPSRKLDLHENSSSGNFISITNDTTGHGAADGALIGLQDDESLIISNKEDNHIEFHTNNDERLRITSAGKVGINDDNPERTLDVVGNNAMIQIEGSGGNGRQYSLCSTDDTTGAAVGSAGQFVIYDDTSGSSRLNITSDGKVGIKETTPEATFEVDGRIRVLDNNDAAPSTGKGLEISYFNTDDMADILSYDRGNGAYKKLQLRGSSVEIKKNNSVLINAGVGGNGITVGFGTTNALVTNAEIIATRGYSSFKSPNASYSPIYVSNEGSTDNVANQMLMFNSGGANRGGFGYVPNTGELRLNNQYSLTFCTGSSLLGGTERLRIHSDGKISLGTSSSASAKFNISHGNELALYTSGPYNYQAKFESTDAEAAIVIEDVNSGSNYNRIGVITNDMTFITNNNERLRITSTGQTLLTRGSQGGRDSTGNASNFMKIGTWYGIDQTSRLKITIFGTLTYDSNADVAGETIIYISNNANNTMKGHFHSHTNDRAGVQKVAFKYDSSTSPTSCEVWIKYNGGYSCTQHKVDASEGYWVGADVDTSSTSVPSGATEASSFFAVATSDGSQSYERLRITSDGIVNIGVTSPQYAKKVNIQGDNGYTLSVSNQDYTGHAAGSLSGIEGRLQCGGGVWTSAGVRFVKHNGTSGDKHSRCELYATDGYASKNSLIVQPDGEITKPYQPSFHVGSPNNSGGSAGHVWKSHSNAIYSNVGSHYDNSTGRFTAPVDGQYFFFHWGMSNSSGQTNDVYSRKNGSRDQIGTSYNHSSGAQHNQFGCSYVRTLSAGDYVDVYTSTGNVYTATDGRHGGWGGHLIG